MIGSRRHLITIQKNTPTRVKGVKTDVWSNVGNFYAEVKSIGKRLSFSGNEIQVANQRKMVSSYEVKIRYRTGESDSTSTSQRVLFNGKAFDIRSVLHLEPRRSFTIMRVQEVVT